MRNGTAAQKDANECGVPPEADEAMQALRSLFSKLTTRAYQEPAENVLETEAEQGSGTETSGIPEHDKIRENPTKNETRIICHKKHFKEYSKILEEICGKQEEIDDLFQEEHNKKKYITRKETSIPFRTLTRKQLKLVRRAFCGHEEISKIFESKGIKIGLEDIRTLAPGRWLNDEIINTYSKMVTTRSNSDSSNLKIHCMSTFFYNILSRGYNNVRKVGRKIQIFSLDLLIIPVHLGNHWICTVINFKNKRFESYDSMRGTHQEILKRLRLYILEESNNSKYPFNSSEWTDYSPMDIPHQTNADDCGVFTCLFMRCISVGGGMSFSAENMEYFRNLICLEILENRLL